MALDFSARTLITNPTAYHLGRSIVFLGLVVIALGGVAWFTGDFLMPAPAWFALAVPTIVIGLIVAACGRTKG